jgi:hypothetical protein
MWYLLLAVAAAECVSDGTACTYNLECCGGACVQHVCVRPNAAAAAVQCPGSSCQAAGCAICCASLGVQAVCEASGCRCDGPAAGPRACGGACTNSSCSVACSAGLAVCDLYGCGCWCSPEPVYFTANKPGRQICADVTGLIVVMVLALVAFLCVLACCLAGVYWYRKRVERRATPMTQFE